VCTIFTAEGHPVFIVLLGAMDVKGLLKAVGEPALMKYLLQLLEEGVKQTVESTRQWGKPISSCTVVCDLEGLCVDHLRRPGEGRLYFFTFEMVSQKKR